MRDDRLYLLHIDESIARIEAYTIDGKAAFLADTKTQDAVLRNLQILAESTQQLTEMLKAQHANIEWRAISAFRNVLVHGYLGVDLEQVWEIVERDLPYLKAKIKEMLEAL